VTHISQREAHRLKRQVAILLQSDADRKRIWTRDYPGGVNIATLELSPIGVARIGTAKRLGCALVATLGTDDKLYIHAIR